MINCFAHFRNMHTLSILYTQFEFFYLAANPQRQQQRKKNDSRGTKEAAHGKRGELLEFGFFFNFCLEVTTE